MYQPPAADLVDQEGKDQRRDHAAHRGEQAVEQRGLERQVEGLAVEGRQPGDHAAGDEVGAEPHTKKTFPDARDQGLEVKTGAPR